MTYGRNKAISATAVPPKKIQPATATAVLSFFFFLFLFFLLYSLLFSWLMVRLWFGFRALPEGVSEVLFFEKRAIFFYLFFAGFPLFFHSFFHSSSQDIPVRERPFYERKQSVSCFETNSTYRLPAFPIANHRPTIEEYSKKRQNTYLRQ